MTETSPTPPLIPSLRRIAQHLVLGATNTDIAAAEGLSTSTVHTYQKDIRQHLGLPPRASRAVIVHALLGRGEATAPEPGRPAPALTADETLLLRAIATRSRQADIALAARIAPADLRTKSEALLFTTGATDSVHLIGLAHAWGLLEPSSENEPTSTSAHTPRPAGQNSPLAQPDGRPLTARTPQTGPATRLRG
ncbi:LuxR C-terminal-related transcriptional regulator [Streptomyces roseoviridis]|uniref:LuxR C-terminal-related transcriptional regulator n=1 Tax=Streptomyces roseoviridis TaxID=67361 RepID=A0ABV5QY35_9ACTN